MRKKQNETNKIFETPEHDLEAIEIVGYRRIGDLQQRYSPIQLRIIEERAKMLKMFKALRHRLGLWEGGLLSYLGFLAVTLVASTLISWVYYDKIIHFFDKLIGGLTPQITVCVTVNSVIITVIRVVDIGRMIKLLSSLRKGDDREEIVDLIFAHFDIGELNNSNTPKEGSFWLSATEIGDNLSIESDPRIIGKVLKNLGFIQKRTAKNRHFLVKKALFMQKSDKKIEFSDKKSSDIKI